MSARIPRADEMRTCTTPSHIRGPHVPPRAGMELCTDPKPAGKMRANPGAPPKTVTVRFLQELPAGPTDAHVGVMVARVTMDAMVVGRVESVGPVANDTFVQLSDGTLRRRELGQWFTAEMAR